MKAILLAPLPPPSGGIAGWTQRMLKANLKNDWTVSVVDEKLTGDRNAKGGGYKKNLLTELCRSSQIWKGLKRQLEDPDAKVVQACIPATVGAILREIVSAKITHRRGRIFITHFRCTVPNMVNSDLQLRLLKMLVKNSDCIFCLNQQTIDFIRSFNKSVDCRNIPNFVDTTETFERTEYAETIKKIVYTGRVLESKGCKLMIDVAKAFPEIKFELIGKVLMDVFELPKNVILSGEQDRGYIRQSLKSADVFMFLTRFPGEGFSNSLAEAMAYSLPCIVTDWAANADMIGLNGGIVLQQATINEVIEAVKSIESVEIRRNMGSKNYYKVLNVYNQKSVTTQYVNAYEEVLSLKKDDSL